MRMRTAILLLAACGAPARPSAAEPKAKRSKLQLDCPSGTAQLEVTDETVCGVHIPTRPNGVIAVCARADGTHHGPFVSRQPKEPAPTDIWVRMTTEEGGFREHVPYPTRSTGSCKDGAPAGTWSHWYEGVLMAQADYLDGVLDGFWRAWYEDGSPRVVGHYRRGKPWGLWSFWDRRGNKTTRLHELRGSNEGVY